METSTSVGVHESESAGLLQAPTPTETASPLAPSPPATAISHDAANNGSDRAPEASMTPPTTYEEPFSESDEDDEEDLLPADAFGIRRRKKRSEDDRIRPAYYWPSGTLARGVPCFEPTEDEFADFNAFVSKIEKYGMTSGIVKVRPPQSWTRALPSVSEQLSEVRLRDPIAQTFLGSSGLYRVANVAKSRIWNAKQWKETADSSRYSTPDFFRTAAAKGSAEDSKSADQRSRETSEPIGGEQPHVGPKLRAAEADKRHSAVSSGGQSVHTNVTAHHPESDRPDTATVPHISADLIKFVNAKKKTTALGRADIIPKEWEEWRGQWELLPHDAKVEDYTITACHDIERAYWRTLTFGEPPMYGADMKGSLFTGEVSNWNVANLKDLLTRLGRYHRIPGVNTPYLYFGMWRATFAWHVEDADLYSINYIHFGAPKFWYSVPQHQAERFERVMGGWFPQERGKCREFLRHKSFLASPKKLANEGITLNKVVQMPGEFILTYPYGYHSGFNVGFNCAESINFATDAWIEIGRKAKPCACVSDSVKIDVDEWLRAAELGQQRKRPLNEPWFARPKRPRLDDEDPMSAAKRTAAAIKRAAKNEAARQAALRAPFVCALCPDMTTDTLVPLASPLRGVRLSNEQIARRKAGAAHKACVMYVPSTYIDVDERGEERVYGFESIEKERWKLKCQLCEDRYGCPVQCTKSEKCVRAQHVTCALKEDSGVVMDALLTQQGRAISLLATDDNPYSPLSSEPEGTVRLVVHCRMHNPEWQRQQADAKAARLANAVAALALGTKLRIRIGGSTFQVTLVANIPEEGLIEVGFEDGKRACQKHATIVWSPTNPSGRNPAESKYSFSDHFVYEHAQRRDRSAIRAAKSAASARPGSPCDPAQS